MKSANELWGEQRARSSQIGNIVCFVVEYRTNRAGRRGIVQTEHLHLLIRMFGAKINTNRRQKVEWNGFMTFVSVGEHARATNVLSVSTAARMSGFDILLFKSLAVEAEAGGGGGGFGRKHKLAHDRNRVVDELHRGALGATHRACIRHFHAIHTPATDDATAGDAVGDRVPARIVVLRLSPEMRGAAGDDA